MTRLDAVAAHFKRCPHEWLSMHTLAQVGGTGGWRSRVAECRTELGMAIENKVVREAHLTHSFYRYVPKQEEEFSLSA